MRPLPLYLTIISLRQFRVSALESMTSSSVFDLASKDAEIARLTQQSQEPGFWDDQRAAQVSMRRLTGLQEEIEQWRGN